MPCLLVRAGMALAAVGRRRCTTWQGARRRRSSARWVQACAPRHWCRLNDLLAQQWSQQHMHLRMRMHDAPPSRCTKAPPSSVSLPPPPPLPAVLRHGHAARAPLCLVACEDRWQFAGSTRVRRPAAGRGCPSISRSPLMPPPPAQRGAAPEGRPWRRWRRKPQLPAPLPDRPAPRRPQWPALPATRSTSPGFWTCRPIPGAASQRPWR